MTRADNDHLVLQPRRGGKLHAVVIGAAVTICGRAWSGWTVATEREACDREWCKACREGLA